MVTKQPENRPETVKTHKLQKPVRKKGIETDFVDNSSIITVYKNAVPQVSSVADNVGEN